MSENTTESEQALEEKLIEISNGLSNDHAKFVEDLYDFGDMWLLCDIVTEFIKSDSERSLEEAGREKSDLMRLVRLRDEYQQRKELINKALDLGIILKTDIGIERAEAKRSCYKTFIAKINHIIKANAT